MVPTIKNGSSIFSLGEADVEPFYLSTRKRGIPNHLEEDGHAPRKVHSGQGAERDLKGQRKWAQGRGVSNYKFREEDKSRGTLPRDNGADRKNRDIPQGRNTIYRRR